MVVAKTADGDIGILRNHMPVLSLLVDGVVEITPVDGEKISAPSTAGSSRWPTTASRSCRSSRCSSRRDRRDQAGPSSSRRQADSDADDAADRVRRAEARIRAYERASRHHPGSAGRTHRTPHRRGARWGEHFAGASLRRRGCRWQWLLDSAGVLPALPSVWPSALVLRRRLLSRHGGTF